jgi:pyruvate,water dikinase
MSATRVKRFASPYEDEAPPGAEGWQSLYPYFLLFQDNRREEEEGKFWFCDSNHWPNVFKPFDTTMVEFACKCLGQYNTRHLMIPPANGVDYRVHRGYCYMNPVAVPAEEIPERVPHFMQRAGHYFENWPALLANWEQKMRGVIADIDALSFEPLPDMVPLDWVTSGKGLDPTYDLIATYNRAIELCYKGWQYHFEFLNLGYAAYLDFFAFCKESFPDIPDLAIARMVQGIEVDLFRPDDELKRLAKLAVEHDVVDALGSGSVEEALAAVASAPEGPAWLAEWEKAKDPWFNYSSGNGLYSDDRVWLDHLDIPLGYLRGYVAQVQRGDDIDRPVEAVAAERDRITSEYRELLPDDEAREAFDAKIGLARLVFPYVENHNFYVEHWMMAVFWRRMRELGEVFVHAGFWRDRDDLFYLRREEILEALFDYGSGWAVGAPAAGPHYWPDEIARRKGIIAALSSRRPLPALNEPPEAITEPFTIMLWGITSERIEQWLSGAAQTGTLTGMAASPGEVEGLARVVFNAADLDQIQDGEILVTQVTAPSWAPVFAKIRAAVTDIGGAMSHAAIVCREYGLPSVTGTGTATTAIATGQRIRVDGTNGVVTILS